MKATHILFGVVVGFVAYGYYAIVTQRGELDIPSYALAKISKIVIREPFPKKDLSDLVTWRRIFNAFALPNNLIYRQSSIIGEDIDINTYLDGKYAPITVRVYKSKFAGSELKPVIVWFHGGGFVLGGIEPDDAMCTELAVESDAVVVSVDYRMAPAHPFPTPIEDSISALQWVSKHISSFGGNSKKIFVAGESAGGTISAAITAHNLDTNYVKEKDRVNIIGSMLIYPAVDITGTYESHDLYGDFCGILTKAQIINFREFYAGSKSLTECAENYLFSPLKAPDDILAQFPPTLVMLAKYDVLLDEGIAMAQKLKKLRVPTELIVYDSTVHFFFGKHFFPQGHVGLTTVANKVKAIASEVK